MSWRGKWPIFYWGFLAALLLGTGFPGLGAAATFAVNSTADAVDAAPGDGTCASGGGICTLRAAIQEANALAGADTIALPAGIYTLTIPGIGEDQGATGDLDVKDGLTLTGAGAAKTVIDGGALDRVLNVWFGVTVQISGLTVRNGNTSDYDSGSTFATGGGIQIAGGDLTMLDVIVTGNSANAESGFGGGGIANLSLSKLTATAVTISGNTAYFGGGIANYGGEVYLTNVTVSDNTSGYAGGGIENSGGSLTITASTIRGNTLVDSNNGSAIHNHNNGDVQFASTTVTGNTNGRAVANYCGELFLNNSTVTGNGETGIWNHDDGNCQSVVELSSTIVAHHEVSNCKGNVDPDGYNLEDGDTCGFTGVTDLINTDPLLGPLAANGGPTLTHALLPGSPAIDRGDSGYCPAADQRGVPRPQDADGVSGYGDGDARCDIGAYEAGSGRAPDLVVGLDSFESNGGWVEAVAPALPHDHFGWLHLAWPGYNAADGQTRPVACDVDGDGRNEVVLGLGPYPENGGWLQVVDDGATGYASLAWVRVDRPEYNSENGETFPACGDLDGDGRDELAIGLGSFPGKSKGGWVEILDDAATGYAHLAWARVNWDAYNAANGETHPAIGNLDGDAAEELILGLGNHAGNGGWVQVLDDASTDFAPLADTPTAGGWVRLDWTSYNGLNGETWPAVCDLNGDGQGELALGVGDGGVGWVQLFDAATGFGPLAGTPSPNGWAQVAWPAYTTTGKGARPACGDLDSDGREELVLGLDRFPTNGGWVEIKDDVTANLAHASWARVHWSAYNSAKGETRPAVGR